jgi:hypothetical protein
MHIAIRCISGLRHRFEAAISLGQGMNQSQRPDRFLSPADRAVIRDVVGNLVERVGSGMPGAQLGVGRQNLTRHRHGLEVVEAIALVGHCQRHDAGRFQQGGERM